MKLIRKSQIAVLSLAIMVMIVGYINYKYNTDREENMGQTVYVNSKDGFMYNNLEIYKDTNDSTSCISTDGKTCDDTTETVNKKQTIYDTKTSSSDDTIAVFRNNRNNMFSEMESNYQKVISNTTVGKEQIESYQNKLNKLIEDKHLITLVEEIIKTKGIDDVAIVPTNGNINVMVKSKEKLTDSQVATIQKIVMDEFKVESKKITIQQS